jgi:uncharacterized FlaG/YvyC family protein
VKALLGENLIAFSGQKSSLASEVSTQVSVQAKKQEAGRGLASSDPSPAVNGAEADTFTVSASAVSLGGSVSDAQTQSESQQQNGEDESLSKSIKDASEERLKKIAEEVNKKLDKSLKIRFGQDETTGIDYFQLIEKKSGDVIRQFPPEEFIEISKSNQDVRSLLFSEQA